MYVDPGVDFTNVQYISEIIDSELKFMLKTLTSTEDATDAGDEKEVLSKNE